MAAHDLITLEELTRYHPISGPGRDDFLRECIARASRRIEQYLDRRIVYRAPGEVEGNGNIVASATCTNGALTVAAQPGSGGRTLIVTFDGSVTSGTVTVTGTVAGTAGVTEVFDSAAGRIQHGVKFFTAISGAAVTGATGDGTVKVGSSQGYIEFHTPYPGAFEIKTLEWPVRQVREVNEDVAATYTAATALTEGTAFQVRKERRRIARVSGQLEFAWLSAYRSVRLIYSAGYFTAASVPDDIKEVACALAAWIYREADRMHPGLQSGSDATGSFVSIGPAMLTTGMKEKLDAYNRGEFERTGERDWDLEAA